MSRYNDNIAAVTGLKYAAGLWIPNNHFRDVNAAMHTGSRTGEDGKTWNKTDANHWYWTTTEVNDAELDAYADQAAMFFTTSSTTPTIDLANHQLGAQTLYSEMIPWNSVFTAHDTRYLQVNFTAQIEADVVEGTHFRIALAQFDSSYTYLDYDPFDLSALTIAASSMTACEAKTTSGLHASTAYVQLHIGLYSPDGGSTAAFVGDVSLMVDPVTATASTTYQDLDSVYLSGAPGMAWAVQGVRDRMNLEGNNIRTNVLKGGDKYQFSAQWHQEDEATYELLRSAWQLSMGAYSASVPEPVPLCCNFGVGMAPHWAYYDVSGSTFNGTFTEQWTVGGQRFDVGLSFMER
jgi:hypothetical protein